MKQLFSTILGAFLLSFIFFIDGLRADMNDPLQSRINQGIVAKLFPESDSIGAPKGDPPYIPVFGSGEESTIDEQTLHRWRQEFLQVNAREPTEEETAEKISSLQKKGAQKEIGFLFSTYETTLAKGYSGDYFDIIVGVSTEGKLKGSVIVELHEPMICPTCVPQTMLEALHDTFVNTNVNRRVDLKAGTGGGRGYDGVAGATISATLTTNGIISGARKVMRMAGLSSNEGPFYLDVDSYKERNWPELLNWGGVVGITLTRQEARKDLSPEQEGYIKDPDKKFINIFAGLGNPASVGRNIFGDKWYSHHVSQIGTGDNLLVIMGSGQWSWKKNNYLDSTQQLGNKNEYNRIQIIQNDTIYRFSANEALSSTAIRIAEKPVFSEIGLLRIPKEWGFKPLEPWKLELVIKEDFGNGSIFLNYNLPKELISGDPVALEDAGLRPIKTAFFGLVRESKLTGWQLEWANQDYSIIFLFLLLIALTFIIIKQKTLSLNRKFHTIIRISFLLIVLFWLGWIAQSQLSIVNIISYGQALFMGKGFTQFLYEPLMTIIFIYTLMSLILLGRGLFCGWLCPFGALQELSFKIGRYLKIPQLNIPFWLNERLWAVKYLILISIISTIIFGSNISYALIEIEPFKTAITSYFNRGLPYVIYASLLLLVGIFSERFFCRFICPLGAILAFLGRIHILKNVIPRRPECGNPCHLCEHACPVQAIAPSGQINMNECFQCLDCEVEYFDEKKCPPLIYKNSLIK